MIGSEVAELVTRLRQEAVYVDVCGQPKPMAINHFFHVVIVNALWHPVAGFRFEYNDPVLKQLIGYTRFRSLDSETDRKSVV